LPVKRKWLLAFSCVVIVIVEVLWLRHYLVDAVEFEDEVTGGGFLLLGSIMIFLALGFTRHFRTGKRRKGCIAGILMTALISFLLAYVFLTRFW